MEMNNQIYVMLDIDGVLATTNQYYSNRKKWHPIHKCYKFDRKCVKVFNDIVDIMNPIIIMTSDWRLRYSIDQLNEIFEWNGVNAQISDYTINLWKTRYHESSELEACRVDEIQ